MTRSNIQNQVITATECHQLSNIPSDYRTEQYRAPTPRCSPFAATLSTRELNQIMKSTPELVLVDVLAIIRRKELADFGNEWLPSKQRFNIPGSVWLPNVGYSPLEADLDQYYRQNLARLSAKDFNHPIVIYCVVDCWISWNAVKRAASYGYRNLYWYPDGTDGWEDEALPLVRSTPVPLNEQENVNER